ncbi:MAG: ATP-dependent RNA helicase HrpA, partial [Planctomycetota bacterium]
MSRPETPPRTAPLPSPDELAARIEDCVASDRPAFARRLASIRRAITDGKPHDRNLGRLDRDTRRSAEVRQQRADAVPAVTYDDTLPVVARRDEIAAAIRDHQVVVVAGETGSGKSTQLPKICLDLGRGVDGLIGHTQPRRIAARSVAARIAEELKVPVGKQVGFQVRFTDATVPETLIKLMTDGILLAEIQGDRLLSKYDTLIIDEAHER